MENIKCFEQELLNTKRAGTDKLVDELRKTDFYLCHCCNHDRQKGGTLNHSLWTLYVARKTFQKNPARYPGVSDDSLVIVCLLHDLGDIRKGYGQFFGHGRKSALILKTIKEKYGLDISDAEMAAIRFHRGHRIVDDFDCHLSAYDQTPLIKLLKHSDRTAAGVMNGVRYGVQEETSINNRESYTGKFFYNPTAKHWYLDTSLLPSDNYPTRYGKVNLKTLTRTCEAKSVFNIKLFHICAYDLRVFKNSNDKLGVFTVVTASMGDGDFYRSDRCGFGYKSVVIYYNRHNDHNNTAHYIVTENGNGLWSVVKLKKGDYSNEDSYTEFIERVLKVKDYASEAEALDAFKHAHHGINLADREYFERILVK